MKVSSRDVSQHEERRRQFLATYNRIRRFATYADGWDLGRGVALKKAAIEVAHRFLTHSYELGLWRTNVFPSPDGAIMFTITQNGHDLEIVIADGERCSIVHEFDDQEVISVENITVDAAKSYIDIIAKKICSSEPSMPPTTMTGIYGDFAVPHSSLRQTVVFQSSTMNAPTPAAAIYVNTSQSTTQMLEEHRPYFGVFQTEPSLEMAA
ncbi:hypothetical protein ACVCIH_13205 [Burkholderia glumae]|uniref:hypothetical protein n=1 Tax=Burkholderia glumae TaxID=337 RepID=UPI000F5E8757|nr:hypothetical protein [Burkholderia glumae]MCM2490862.1 hypothetical protein [Burkholderia glumae]MCR1766655.1 hypothetical protein [Burkholderia glumae]